MRGLILVLCALAVCTSVLGKQAAKTAASKPATSKTAKSTTNKARSAKPQADSCGNNLVEYPEQCDGLNLLGRTCQSFGFYGGTLACGEHCVYDMTGCARCGDGTVSGDEECDTDNLNGMTCDTLPGYDFVGGTLACWHSNCKFDTRLCHKCGDGVIDLGEDCDGANLGGETCDTLGYNGGTLGCSASCEWDFSSCVAPDEPSCGNNVHEAGEMCDGTDTPTCVEAGYVSGTMSCNADCTLDASQCVPPVCGNDVLEPGEACDTTKLNGKSCSSLGYGSGVLTCSPSCHFDTSGCAWCGNNKKEGFEQCDMHDLDGLTCATLPFPYTFTGGTLACTASCGFATWHCNHCGDGILDPAAGEVCDPGCPAPGCFGGETCLSRGYLGGGDLICTEFCTISEQNCVQLDPQCGNGIKEGDEACDGTDGLPTHPSGHSCVHFGFSAGDVACAADCTFDLSPCSGSCGNDILEGAEECDDTQLNGYTCANFGLAGALACKDDCTFDKSGCSLCGNGIVEPLEDCDGVAFDGKSCEDLGHTGGTLICDDQCKFDEGWCTNDCPQWNNGMYFGFGYKNTYYGLPTYEQCCHICSNDANCHYFTWSKGTGHCFIYPDNFQPGQGQWIAMPNYYTPNQPV